MLQEVKKLDLYANNQFMGVLQHGICCAGIGSEETDAAFSTALRTTAGAMSKTGKMIPGATRTDTLVDEEDDKERNMIKINRLLERRLIRKL